MRSGRSSAIRPGQSGRATTLAWSRCARAMSSRRSAFDENLTYVWAQADRRGTALALSNLALVALHHGAATSGRRSSRACLRLCVKLSVPRCCPLTESIRSALAVARAALDGATWTAGWSTGRALPLAQAVAYALTQGPEHMEPQVLRVDGLAAQACWRQHSTSLYN